MERTTAQITAIEHVFPDAAIEYCRVYILGTVESLFGNGVETVGFRSIAYEWENVAKVTVDLFKDNVSSGSDAEAMEVSPGQRGRGGERKKKRKRKTNGLGPRTSALPRPVGLCHENYTIAPSRIRLKTSLIPLSTFLKFYQQLISSLSWVNCFSSPKFPRAHD
jgi:hypothetical protein